MEMHFVHFLLVQKAPILHFCIWFSSSDFIQTETFSMNISKDLLCACTVVRILTFSSVSSAYSYLLLHWESRWRSGEQEHKTQACGTGLVHRTGTIYFQSWDYSNVNWLQLFIAFCHPHISVLGWNCFLREERSALKNRMLVFLIPSMASIGLKKVLKIICKALKIKCK